ncbi:hypothetical protein SLEP1_g57061 [Rubroshorea leprosula]|uniref:Uncharacterized protein n=1 Tax=Rubroshorea leprosula TaxID=152421 RepID=A0AAV5MLP2_9ROSI|nr:hypothetical protein SLEP1_g57061 [Rubroshorea leprosula]
MATNIEDVENYSLSQGELGHAASQDEFGQVVETFANGQNNLSASKGLKIVKIEKEDRPTKAVYKAKCKNQRVP